MLYVEVYSTDRNHNNERVGRITWDGTRYVIDPPGAGWAYVMKGTIPTPPGSPVSKVGPMDDPELFLTSLGFRFRTPGLRFSDVVRV